MEKYYNLVYSYGIVALILIAIFLIFIAILLLLVQGFGKVAFTQTLIIEDVLIPLSLAPCLFMYLFKSIALFYISE